MIRKLKEWSAESERAVSPVIGVILMVAITVILAAVIGSFVLGIGGDIEQTPQVRLEVSDAGGDITDANGDDIFTIRHNGGEPLSADDVRLEVTNVTGSGSVATDGFGSDLRVGDTETISEDGSTNSVSDGPVELEVRLVHQPSDSLLLDTTITVE